MLAAGLGFQANTWSAVLCIARRLEMRRFRCFASAPRSIAKHSGQVSPALDLVGKRKEGFLTIIRSICGLSPCNPVAVQRPLSILRAWMLSSNRNFHATGFLCAMGSGDYYDILGVAKDATQDDIKKAFHALAKKYHPDVNKNNPTAKRKFQEVRDAYETLRDPEKRAHYDMGGENLRYATDGAKGFQDAYEEYATDQSARFHRDREDPFSDTFYKIFSEVFENESESFAPDIEVKLKLTFSEAAKGCTKHLSFRAQVVCDSCLGRGHPKHVKPSKCPNCNGTGRVTVFPFTSTCNACKGLGKTVKAGCQLCRGSGVVEGMKNINVAIPAGVDSGDTINVPKAGNSGGRRVHPGNLYIKLQVAKDPVFVRDGADIYVDSHISFTDAILGGKVEVPTLFGKTEVKIPKGVQPGQLLVLRARGLPKRIGLVDHGDQYVRFRVHFPSKLNERQRALMEEFAKEEAIQENNGFADGNWWQQITDYLIGPKFMLGIGFLLLIHLLLSKSMT
ncbi:chaperone protein dnaJ 1, mitochondrial isoform X2 [Dioscorea cayenensis subsp. rotundata]|uniref:Chaperone protein dnaJ 1, mitochondrial isoform X2 n=1 Tax=Dioscorea cayennensis subsp. rotundata TaxID=55577 RepID=A0AB40CXS0_DIOCR|nr:chaperone protein dnaJ 1, mitochondrial isoform X2 [Dioscorea cayenensis subsp. rotundata]